MKEVRIALLGIGRIGRELSRRTLQKPLYRYVAVGDTSGVLMDDDAFSVEEMARILGHKERGGRLRDYPGGHEYHEGMMSVLRSQDVNALVETTDAQTYDVLIEALEYAHVLVSNKIPIADVPYSKFQRLVSKSREAGRALDLGTTVGAGMRVPDMIRMLGSDGIDLVTGCLSGTMNYVSQRINEGSPLSTALKEAAEPPRCYAEPDPRVDLKGEDFARKLVILGRMCGKGVERSMVEVEALVLDPAIKTRLERAKGEEKTIWYMGTADLQNNEYRVGFEDIPLGDPMTRARESDNVLKFFPSRWRRPVTLMGPGAGPPETVTGLIYGLSSISDKL